MGHIHVDEMSVDILCTDLCDFRAKSVGAVSKNVFEKPARWWRYMGQIHFDDMSVDMLCSDLCDFRAKSVGVVSKNVF